MTQKIAVFFFLVLTFVDSGQGQVVGLCEYGNETEGSIKCGAFLDEELLGSEERLCST